MSTALNIISLLPPAPPQAAQTSSAAPASPDGSHAPVQGSQDTQQQAGQSQNTGNNAGNDNTHADGNHFGRLLDTHGQNNSDTIPASAPLAGNTAQVTTSAATSADTSSSGSGASSGSGSASVPIDSFGASIIAALLLSQAQDTGNTQTQTSNTAQANSAVSSGNGSASDNGDALLALQQILQELLQIAQQIANGAPQAPTSSSGNGGSSQAAQGASSASGSSTNPGDALAQVLAQIAALLQQLSAQAGNTPAPGNTKTDVIAASTDSTAGSNPAASLLAQLANELGQLQNTATPETPAPAAGAANKNSAGIISANANTDTDTNTPPAGAGITFPLAAHTNIAPKQSASSGNGVSSLTNTFPVTNTTQSNDTSHTLKSLIAQANDLLDAIRGSKQDSSSSGDGSSTGSSFSATPQVLPGATQNAQAPQPGDFLKLVHTSASSAPVPVADQVLVQIKSAGADSGSQIKIQLHPEDLGKVVVQMNTDSDGKTGISITADNRQTLALLQNEARSLENALRDIGLKTDTGGLSFNLSGQQHQQQNPNSFGGYTQVAAATTDDDADYYTAPTAIYSLGIQQGLDIRV